MTCIANIRLTANLCFVDLWTLIAPQMLVYWSRHSPGYSQSVFCLHCCMPGLLPVWSYGNGHDCSAAASDAVCMLKLGNSD